jgi:hypothetical protein
MQPVTRVFRSPAVWIWALVALGVALRVSHVLRDPPLWHDEAALVLNAVYLDVSQCFGKLLHHEAAPPLFLVLERITMLAIGDSELELRLPVFLVGCASLVLFAQLAGRVCGDRILILSDCAQDQHPVPTPSRRALGSAVLAVGLFAFSDRLIWHAAEAKPYAVDVFVAVLAAWLYLRTRELPLRLQCLVWLPILPVAEWSTFPGCFVAGGVLLALLPPAWRARWPDQLAYAALGLAVVGSFVVLALGPAKAQQDGAMTGCWAHHFADWSRPATVPMWAVVSTTEVLRYALMPVGQVLMPVAVVGAIRLGRRDRRLLALLLAQLGLSLVAALVGKYPYGGARVCAFAAPALILLVAAGTPACWTWLRGKSRFAPALLVVALSMPVAQTAYRAIVPWPRADFREAVDYVNSQFEPGDVIASDHWEVLYYTRDCPERACDFPELADRRPDRIWVLTGTDPGIGEARFQRIPADWQRVNARTFHGTIVVLFEYRPPPAASTSAIETIP